jgi:hypothetical protein
LKLGEHRRGQLLGEDVTELGGCWDVEDTHISNGDTHTYEVEVDLNMLGALMLHRVGGEVDRADVVSVDEWPTTGGCATPEAADEASTPLPRRWLRCGSTPPRHSSGRRWSGASRTRR